MKTSTIEENNAEEKKQKRFNLLKKVPAHPRLQLKHKIMLKNLQIKKEKGKRKPKVEPETDTYNIGKDKETIFVEDDFDYNAKGRSKKRKIIYTPEELKVIANKRKKRFENPPHNWTISRTPKKKKKKRKKKGVIIVMQKILNKQSSIAI